MNPSDSTVVTIDPASGEWRRRSSQVLDLEWKNAGFATLVVTGERQARTPRDRAGGTRPAMP
ncbi:MAG: hypothetical protein H7138_07050 [Myxococcales bacterium]|nr:hypothetical protein [Myxococcales bacterium]